MLFQDLQMLFQESSFTLFEIYTRFWKALIAERHKLITLATKSKGSKNFYAELERETFLSIKNKPFKQHTTQNISTGHNTFRQLNRTYCYYVCFCLVRI